MPNQPSETFDTRFAQLCEAFELTTRGEWHNEGNFLADENTVVVGDESYNWRMVAHTNSDDDRDPEDRIGAPSTPRISKAEAKANADFIALVKNAFPAIKDELERLRKLESIPKVLVVQLDQALNGTVTDASLIDLIAQAARVRAELSTKNEEIEQAAKEAELHRQEFNLEWAKRREAEQKLESQASQLTEARARIERLETAATTCWHCRVVLAEPVKPRCEDCPDECDIEGCDKDSCA